MTTTLPLVLFACPAADCDQVAELIDTQVFVSTGGHVHMWRTRCIRGHIYDTYTEHT